MDTPKRIFRLECCNCPTVSHAGLKAAQESGWQNIIDASGANFTHLGWCRQCAVVNEIGSFSRSAIKGLPPVKIDLPIAA